MKVYLVGGAVRSSLLGVPPADKDWVVIDMDPEDMLAAGYKQVGKDFPVFLHPETGEECALARAERVNGKTQFGKAVSLEEDLSRRDFTMNAMALDEEGKLVDPFGGASDVADKLLRMVSEQALKDDPVRIFRAARFSASLGFDVEEKTRQVMSSLSKPETFSSVPPERIFAELMKGMNAAKPSLMWKTLQNVGALSALGFHFSENSAFECLDESPLSPEEKFALLIFATSDKSLPEKFYSLRSPSEVFAGLKTLQHMCETLPVDSDSSKWSRFLVLGGARQNKERFLRFHDEMCRLGVSNYPREILADFCSVLRETPSIPIKKKEDYENFVSARLSEKLIQYDMFPVEGQKRRNRFVK